jgi:uncharacterized membrane protein YdjX (TVP38/TMEM64 family)
MLGVIVCLIGAGVYVLLGTDAGARLRANPHQFRAQAQVWAAGHRLMTPVLVVGLYIVLTVAMMPVWWVEVLAGAALGMVWGVVWCELGAMLGAVMAFVLARWLAADFFRGKIESKLAKLKALDEKLSHNGFLVVMVARLIHVLPFGASYYMFGLTTMTVVDVAVGTVLGYLPSCMLLVRTGLGLHHGHTVRFVLTVAAIQGVLLVPVLLRYMAPGWFKKMGIE